MTSDFASPYFSTSSGSDAGDFDYNLDFQNSYVGKFSVIPNTCAKKSYLYTFDVFVVKIKL